MQKIDHTKEKIEQALGFKSGSFDGDAIKIIDDYFVNETHTANGHGKISVALIDVLKVAKKRCFNMEGNEELSEYEGVLIFLSYLIGAEIATKKQQIEELKRSSPLAALLGGGNPFGGGHPLSDLLSKLGGKRTGPEGLMSEITRKVKEAKANGEGPECMDRIIQEVMGSLGDKKKPMDKIVMKVDSREEAELHQRAISALAAGKLDESIACIQEIKQLKTK